MRDEAQKRIGHLYPKVDITASVAAGRPDLKPYVGKSLTAVAWLWARTVKSPNPAFAQVDIPLTSTFMLSTKKGKEIYVEPVIDGDGYNFTVKVGTPTSSMPENGTKAPGRGANFRCLMSGALVDGKYIKAEGKAGRMGARLMAVVVEGDRRRMYLPPTTALEEIARSAEPKWYPEGDVPPRLTGGTCVPYGLQRWRDLFTARQLTALTTFADLVSEVRARVSHDATKLGVADDGRALAADGAGASAYGDAVAVYLAFAISKLADRGSTICTWFTDRDSTRNTFARQSIPMTWDYAELNTLLGGTGSFVGAVDWTAESIEGVAAGYGSRFGTSRQLDATTQTLSKDKVISTDPPYYDNIGYADLSDFFYVWLRTSLRAIFPDLFATLAVPKAEELVATTYRHGSREKAELFFLEGMTQAMHRLAEQAHAAFPVTIYYAFKQAESDEDDGTASTGWDTFLDAVIRAGFSITGTWPMRTELSNRMIGSGTNALASSIVLVCRPRVADAPTAARRDFVTALKGELPAALAHLQRGNIAPVDLAQAAIGPGMAVYTRYAKVLDAKGEPLSVREALGLINQTLDEALAEQEGDFDADSRWALAWFEQSGFSEGDYGVAETLSTAKNTSVGGMVEAGILSAGRGKVRLLRPDELPVDWDPEDDRHTNTWEMLHHMIRVLEHAGESAAAQLVAKYGTQAEVVRELAYRLYTLCERKKRAQEATSYNALVQSWPEIMRLAQENASKGEQQAALFDQE
ncbi:MAG TPA: hypothetical protein VJM31_04165 [Vicinamibacterales bacterium]|nr:hypothetical protein [Vicinamibacterales bacterium]